VPAGKRSPHGIANSRLISSSRFCTGDYSSNSYYGYARADRKRQGRESITAGLVANLITGADRVLSDGFASAQIQGYFDIPFDHVYGSPVRLNIWQVKPV